MWINPSLNRFAVSHAPIYTRRPTTKAVSLFSPQFFKSRCPRLLSTGSTARNSYLCETQPSPTESLWLSTCTIDREVARGAVLGTISEFTSPELSSSLSCFQMVVFPTTALVSITSCQIWGNRFPNRPRTSHTLRGHILRWVRSPRSPLPPDL